MSPHRYLIIATLVAVTAGVTADIFTRKIPNALTVGAALTGLAMQAGFNGLDGVLDGLGGFSVTALFFFPLYLARWMGAGDVKLLMAIGVCLGYKLGFIALMATLFFGASIGLGILMLFGGFWLLLGRYGQILKIWMLTGQVVYLPPQQHETSAIKFPYAIAIFLGTLTAINTPDNWPRLLEYVPAPFS